MRQRIICGVDDSERTFEAVAVACDLARRLELPLMLAHVVDEPASFPFGESEVMDRERQQRHARGVEVLRSLAMTFELPQDTELRAESGEPAPMLRALAAEEHAALVVVASRGRGRIRSALFGSVTANLADDLPCPLLVVAPGTGTKYRTAGATYDATVVCGIDGTTAVEVLMPQADNLASALNARLLIIHADLPPMTIDRGMPTSAGVSIAGAPTVRHDQMGRHDEMARDRLEWARDLSPKTPQVDTRVELGDLAATMTDLAEQPSVQVLAIAQDSPWQRLATRAGCPVLVVPSASLERGSRAAAGAGAGESEKPR